MTDIEQWLENLGFAQYARAFTDNDLEEAKALLEVSV